MSGFERIVWEPVMVETAGGDQRQKVRKQCGRFVPVWSCSGCGAVRGGFRMAPHRCKSKPEPLPCLFRSTKPVLRIGCCGDSKDVFGCECDDVDAELCTVEHVTDAYDGKPVEHCDECRRRVTPAETMTK